MTIPYELTPEPGPIAIPPQSVAEDIPCRRCGYNLRGQPVASRCPECGVPVNRVFGSINDGTTLSVGGERVKTIGEVLLLALNSLGFALQTCGTKIDLQRRSA